MKRVKIVASMAICLIMASGTASALTIVDLYGDKDGFGLGLTHGYTQPTWPEAPIVQGNPADTGTITDTKLWSDQTYSHSYDISGMSSITSVELELMTFAQGWKGVSKLYLDGQYIGTLLDGDNTWENSDPNVNIAWKQSFDLTAYANAFDGANTMRIDTYSTGDWWYLDYSQLTIEGTANPSPVPEPSTTLLFGSGLAGLCGVMRRKLKK